MTGTPIVALDGVSVRLGSREVTHDVGFEIRAGESFALVGESGSGKTVTARVVTGLLDRIGGVLSSGTLLVDGRRVASDDPAWARIRGRDIALVPQASLSSLDPVMRIGGQLAETIRRLDPEAAPEPRQRELLDQVRMPRIDAVLRSYPHELSGGMRQRVMIALALAGRPRLMVADEPTTALDVTVQAGILQLLTELRRETGMALLMIAHDLAVVRQVADRVAVMRSGHLVEAGDAKTVLVRPEHPYTRALLAARPERSAPGRPLAVLDRATGELTTPPLPPAVEVGSEAVVTLSDVSVTYRGSVAPAVAPMSLQIRAGDAIGIVGESGSGKTTLGRVIVGAIAPSSGGVVVDGAPWNRSTQRGRRRREIQMIFQDPFGSLSPWRTPRETVAEVLRTWTPQSRRAAAASAADLLDEVGLPRETMDRLPRGLSGGQCQRVGIARALACDPRLLVADEPTSALDISAQAQILNLLMRLRADRGLALVLVSHDLGVVRHMVEHIIVMRQGEVVEQGPAERVFRSPREDYTRELIAATPRIDGASGRWSRDPADGTGGSFVDNT